MSQSRVAPGTAATPPEERDGTRRRFLRAVHEVVPDVVDDLCRLPPLSTCPWVPDGGALRAWAQRWRLDVPWVIRAAGAHYEERVRLPQWQHLIQWGDHDGGSVLEVHPPVWRVNWDTAAMYRQRIEDFISDIETQIDAGTLQINGAAVAVVSPRRRDAASFDRLVKYQVLGQSARAIARADRLQATNAHADVLASLRELAALIELPLRQRDYGGRPPKNR